MKRFPGSVTMDSTAGHPFYGNQHIGGMSFKNMSTAEKNKALLKAKKILQPATMKTQSKANIEMAEKLLAAHGWRSKQIAAQLKGGSVKASVSNKYQPVYQPTSLKQHAAAANQAAQIDMPKTTHQLTDTEFKAVQNYTGAGYKEMNRIARGEIKEQDAHPAVVERIKQLDKAVEKGKLAAPTTLYRGISRDSAAKLFGSEIKTGDHFVDKGFVSTSKGQDFANQWKGSSGIVLHIAAPKGATALDVHKMSSVGASEREIILPRNSKFEVTSVSIPASSYEPINVKVRYVQ